MNSRKIPGYRFFPVNHLENSDISGNKESDVLCDNITFNGICHRTKDLLN